MSALELSERPRSLVHLMARKGQQEALAAAIKSAFALDLPAPGQWTAGADALATGIEPRAWLLDAAPDFALAARAAEAVGALGAVVDQTHGRAALRLVGADARRALATLCRLDFHPRVFGPGSSAATRIGHVACVIRLIDETPSFDLIVGSTYARWLIEEVSEAAHGLSVVRAPTPYRSALPRAAS